MADMLTHERPLPFFTEKGKHQKTDLCPLSKGALQIRLKDGKGQVVFFRSSLKNIHLKPLPSFILSVVIFVPKAVLSKTKNSSLSVFYFNGQNDSIILFPINLLCFGNRFHIKLAIDSFN